MPFCQQSEEPYWLFFMFMVQYFTKEGDNLCMVLLALWEVY